MARWSLYVLLVVIDVTVSQMCLKCRTETRRSDLPETKSYIKSREPSGLDYQGNQRKKHV